MIHFDIALLNRQKEQLEEEINAEDFWQDNKKALSVVNKANDIKEKLDNYYSLENKINDANEMFTLLKSEYDEEMHA